MLTKPMMNHEARGGPYQAQQSPGARRKRKQVSRACDECRSHRTKCDTGRPCGNCSRRSRPCSNLNARDPLLKSRDEDTIARLQLRIQHLEVALREQQQSNIDQTTDSSGLHVFLQAQEQFSGVSGTHAAGTSSRKYRQGIACRAPRSPHESWMGPSSLYYFANRLCLSLQACQPDKAELPDLAPSIEDSAKLLGTLRLESSSSNEPQVLERAKIENFTPTQEQYITDRYWESVHTAVFPILNETEFKRHHQSLWDRTGLTRKPSALVDIVLALCMQLGLPGSPDSQRQEELTGMDLSVAGQRYFRRCQALLNYEMESPSIATLQCHLLCALYVCAGSFHNMVDTITSLAVRTAYILGLHIDPPDSMPRKVKEERLRLWWATFVLETKISTKLGRPFLIDDSFDMPQAPVDDVDSAMLSGSFYAPIGPNETWLSFNTQQVALYRIMREAHAALANAYDPRSPVDDAAHCSSQLEYGAESLRIHIQHCDEWRDGVPEALKTKRCEGGVPYSVDGTTLNVECFAPLWLQRQCLILELTFHHHVVHLLRQLLSFDVEVRPKGFLEELSYRCAAHAVSFTHIVLHVLTKERTLDGWNEAFHWQWNITITLVGCLMATFSQQDRQLTEDLRHALDCAVVICDKFANGLAAAAKAATALRDLIPWIDRNLRQRESRARVADCSAQEGVDDLVTDHTLPFDAIAAGQTPIVDHPYGITNQDLFETVMAVDFWENMDIWLPNLDDIA